MASKLLHLKFENNVLDETENNNDGTVVGTTSYVAGRNGQAFDFNGSTRITIANESNFDFLDFNSKFTVSFWIKVTVAAVQLLISKQESDLSSQGFSLRLTSAANRVRLILTDMNEANSFLIDTLTSPTINDGEWHFIVFTYDGLGNQSGVLSYVDGGFSQGGTSLDGSSWNAKHSQPVVIASNTVGSSPLTGQIDDVRIFDYVLTATEIKNMFNEFGRMLLRLKFENNKNDSSAFNNSVALGGGSEIYVPSLNSEYGNAYQFDETNRLEVTPESNFDFHASQPFTLSGWIKPDSTASNGFPVVFGKRPSNTAWQVYWNRAALELSLKIESTIAVWEPVTVNDAVPANVWTHFVITYDGRHNRIGIRIYINGILNVTGTNGSSMGDFSNSQALMIGANTPANVNPFKGLMDDLRIYDYELTAGEIRGLYNQTKFIPHRLEVSNKSNRVTINNKIHRANINTKNNKVVLVNER